MMVCFHYAYVCMLLYFWMATYVSFVIRIMDAKKLTDLQVILNASYIYTQIVSSFLKCSVW